MKLLAGSMALAAAGCGKPHEEIVPYVEMPERLIPGIPLQFATTLALAGYGRGAIVTSHEGRPTKIEGNPRLRAASAQRMFLPRPRKSSISTAQTAPRR